VGPREPQLSELAWSFLNSRRIYRADETLLRGDEAPVKSVLATVVRVVNQELVLERPDASRIDVLVSIAPLRDAAGRVGGAVNIFQDISEIRRAKQEREQLRACVPILIANAIKCKTIVAQHGGRIWVKSEGTGRGATFFLTLSAVASKTHAVAEGEAIRLP
jgi:signal transduction histidine kinase